MTDTPLVQRVRALVDPIATDLELDVYDVEQRGGTLRVTLDTHPGSPTSITLDQLALATRLLNRELEHGDPVPGKYTLEVTSPGVERTLRMPSHFQREIGKTINVRLADAAAEQRRFEGVLVAADERTATIRIADDDGDDDQVVERTIEIASIDRARTVFVWGPQPKPGQPKPKPKQHKPKPKPTGAGGKQKGAQRRTATAEPASSESMKESS